MFTIKPKDPEIWLKGEVAEKHARQVIELPPERVVQGGL